MLSVRLRLLGQWALDNREREDAAEVVEFALKLAIRTTAYAPNARILRELATPLPFISDESVVRSLSRSFDSQKGAIEHLGPTEDFVRLTLLLAQAESKYDIDASRNRVIDTYFYISALDDLAIKAGSLAWLVASLSDIDPQEQFEAREGIHEIANEELKKSIKQLLNTTADHYRAIRHIVRALAKARPDMAFEVCQALNTQLRRDQALHELVESALHVAPGKINVPFIEQVMNRFATPELQDEALLSVIEKLSKISEKETHLIGVAMPLINRIKSMSASDMRARAYCQAYSLLINKDKSNKYNSLASSLLDQLKDTWVEIDVGWQKVDIGFKIAESLAETSLQKAREFLALTEESRDLITLNARIPAKVYRTCLRLTIRAYSSLLAKALVGEEDRGSIASLIGLIPSNGEQAKLWVELALQCYASKQIDECKRIVDQYIKPLLSNIPSADAHYRTLITVRAAPALYFAHQLTALEQISQLPQPHRDRAYVAICRFMLTKQIRLNYYCGCHVIEGRNQA